VTLLLIIALLFGGGLLYAPDKDRAALEAQYATLPSEFISVAGLRVHVRDSGPRMAPAIVLLHGFGASLHTWDAWAQALQATHRVVRLDLPGAGLTGADPSGDYSDARAVQVISTLLDELDVGQAALVGHSMGGRLAWRFAAEQPRRVQHLVLIAPDGLQEPGSDDAAPASPGLAARLLQFTLPKALVRSGLASAYADPQALSEATVDRYHDLLLAPQVRAAMLARLSQQAARSAPDDLARINAPVLLLWGEQDRLIAPARAQAFMKRLPQAQLVLLPAVGHVPHEEAPQASLAALRAFLKP
jgi:pimeloyl-ACP methyl ester carboxylesterase